MKTQTFRAAAILLLSAITFIGCDNDDEKKDNSLLFKNTVWTGEFNYTGTLVQPISIEFKEGGQLTWYELSGENPGTWEMKDNRISVSFLTGKGFSQRDACASGGIKDYYYTRLN